MAAQSATVNSLKFSTIRSTLWTFLGYGLSQVLRVANNLIMTRLLVPEMFGLMAVVSVIMMGLELCTDAGFMGYVVRHEKGHQNHVLNTTWTIKVIRGGILWGVAALLGVGIWLINLTGLVPEDSVYGHPLLPWLVAVVGFSTVLNGLTSTNIFLASRNMALGRSTVIEIISQVFSIVVMIIWASIDPSVWALAAGLLARALLMMILSHTYLSGPKNRFTWDRDIAQDLYHFGKWVFLASGMTFLATQGDRLMLGGYLTAHDFGLYSIAAFIVLAFDSLFVKLTTSVWYPGMCRIHRENPGMLVQFFYRVRLLQQIATVSVALLLAFWGTQLIGLLFPDEYQEAGPIVRVLAMMLIFSSLEIAKRCLMARGLTVVNTSYVFIRAVVLWVSMPVAFHYAGVYGVLWAIVLNPLAGYPVILKYLISEKIIAWPREILSMTIWSAALITAYLQTVQ